MSKSFETVELLIDGELLSEVEAIIEPMNLTVEELSVQFFEWCARCPEDAKAFLESEIQIQ